MHTVPSQSSGAALAPAKTRPAKPRVEFVSTALSNGDALPFAPNIDWASLEPQGIYAKTGRRLLNAFLLVATFAPVVVLGLLVALVNAIAFRSFRQIFYVQLRAGRRGRIFRIYKFRTMREQETEPDASSAWSPAKDAARVTPLGRFLRSSHLDELPQYLNVVRGEMTFIGPRPEMIEVELWADANVPNFVQRLVLTPGITGYAQITQGYTSLCPTAYATKLAINEHYRTNLSLWMDVEIILRTILWMFRGGGWNWKHGEVRFDATKRVWRRCA